MPELEKQTGAPPRPKRRDERRECNEEVMLDAITKKGYVELRVAFQIYWPQRQRWVGLKGTSFTGRCKTPGKLLQAVQVVRSAMFNPALYPPPSAG